MSDWNVKSVLEAMFGTEAFRMAGGGWLVQCPVCKKSFTLADQIVYSLQRYSFASKVREMLSEEPGALCEICRADYGNFLGFLRADEITERRMALEERDGISPMVGAE